MALTSLTRVQQATVIVLVEARRLDAVPADLARASSFLRQAEERLDQLPLLTSVTVRYGVAYDACHDTGEALLAAYGFRTTNGPGQHEALGRYLRAVFDKPPAERAAREFDRLRRARNQDRYEARPVGVAATEKAEQVARTLFDAARARGISRPDLRSANSSQEVRRGPNLADDVQRSHRRVSSGQSAVSAISRRWPTTAETPNFVSLQRVVDRVSAVQTTCGPAAVRGESARSAEALRVRCAAVGQRCAQVSRLVVAFEGPRARWTVTTSHPAAIRPEA